MKNLPLFILLMFVMLTTAQAQKRTHKKEKVADSVTFKKEVDAIFDSLSKNINLPQIIHIPTHGFFISDNELDSISIGFPIGDEIVLVDTIINNEKLHFYEHSPKKRTPMLSLSLVESVTYTNWENQKENFKRQHQNNDLLLAFAKTDSW